MLDQMTIETIVGFGGTMIDDVLKISAPRKDVKVTVDGFEIIPFMGLTSWAAFRKGSQQVTVMGDIVLMEDEIGGAVSSAVESGLYVTALHNHFIREQPSVMFMHIEATADEATLGRGVRAIFESIKTVRQAHPVAPAVEEVLSGLDIKALEEIGGKRRVQERGIQVHARAARRPREMQPVWGLRNRLRDGLQHLGGVPGEPAAGGCVRRLCDARTGSSSHHRGTSRRRDRGCRCP